MDIRIQALHFEATTQLKEFIQKKLGKLNRFADDIQSAEVILKVTKPEVSNNKEASIKLKVSGPDFYVEKIGNSFEESIGCLVQAYPPHPLGVKRSPPSAIWHLGGFCV